MYNSFSGMEELKIVLLGKTGAGKSSVGNAILGEKVFTGACSVKSETQNCERAEKVISGRRIIIREELKHEIISSLVECAPGPHVFILVLKVERYTQENQQAVEKLLEYFTESIFPHMILLFTHGDDLDENTEIQQFINRPNCNLEYVTKKSGDRVHVVDNKHWNKNTAQTPWFNSVKNILKENKGQHYTNEALEEIGKAINEEVEKILKELGVERETVDMVEIKRKARERVRDKLAKKLVGVAVGTVLGAFLGVGVGLAAPVVIMASQIRRIWKALTHPRPQREDASANAEAGCSNLEKAYFGTALSLSGAISMGLATGLGALGAGGGAIFGPMLGWASGYEEAKMTPNSKQAAKKVAQTAFKNAGDFLKECWDVGDVYTQENCKAPINENNKKQE
uniref:AIG1-type G domain-containing protein n=1 Tax=Astyanax mexicanus TaxID=7994 RepID=A0A3B1IZU3_ASTMX